MTDNIRQEAVERACSALGDLEPTRYWWEEAEVAIDASGLIEQLTQATEDIRGLSALLWEAATERNEAREQLAAERALSDRLVGCVEGSDGDVLGALADYDALRATERAL